MNNLPKKNDSFNIEYLDYTIDSNNLSASVYQMENDIFDER